MCAPGKPYDSCSARSYATATILGSMKRADELVSSFNRSWKRFSGTWKKARADASEKSVHDLRVNTRRIIATLELARVLSNRGDIAKVQRCFKKVLKSMGPLRDVQVQLDTVSRLRQRGVIGAFMRRLKRREGEEIHRIQNALKRGRKRNLAEEVNQLGTEIGRLHESLDGERIHRSVNRVLSVRQNEFSKAKRRFDRRQLRNEETLHVMRIALKKLRYVVEALEPVLGPSAKIQARQMHAFQQLMGECRDMEILRTELENWAKKKGKTIAIVPMLEQLHERREVLLKKIIESSDKLQRIVEPVSRQPFAEKTQVAASPVWNPESTYLPTKTQLKKSG